MSKQKHLVLDDDVHEILTSRKELMGLSIRELGNCFLRASLAPVLLCSIVGRMLVGLGKVSEDEYRHVLEEAHSELRHSPSTGRATVAATGRGTLVSGSWEIRDLFRDSDSVFQVLECWAKDSHQLPMEPHCHNADEFFIALSGRTLVMINGTPVTLSACNMLQVPAGCVHSGTPMTPDCHLLAVVVPAVSEYSASAF